MNCKGESQVWNSDLETNINTLTSRILAKSKVKGFVESISKTMEHFLNDLDDINLWDSLKILTVDKLKGFEY